MCAGLAVISFVLGTAVSSSAMQAPSPSPSPSASATAAPTTAATTAATALPAAPGLMNLTTPKPAVKKMYCN